ncbi:hypothetical protein PTKIN_Ptkin18bG0120800 [Pterospermum kingtungense]
MGNHMQNKISMDIAADSSSLDSLSFSGLVCIQDQQSSKSPTKRPYHHNDDQEFEFVSSTSLHSLNKNPHPDMIISNSHLLPLEFLLKKSTQSHAGYKQSRPPSLGSSKTPIDSRANNHTKASEKSNQEANGQVKTKQTASRSWFQSFVSPCRECRAESPTVKAHAAPRERVKLRK